MSEKLEHMDFEEPSKSLKDYFNMLRRRKRVLAIAWLIVVVIFILLAFLWPPTYRSQSIILIEQQDIPAELVQTTITSYAQQRIEEIKQRIMTISNIMDLAEEFELYSEREFDRMTRTEIAVEFRDAVSIKPISAEVVDPRSGRPSLAIIAFSLAFDGDSPSKVQKVTNEITTLFLNENLKERTEQTQSTADFLTAETEMLSQELASLDQKIAEFKEQNKGALPEQNQFNTSMVDRTESQINDLDFQLKELKKRKIRLEGELTQISPSAPTILADGSVVLGNADRLRALQSQLRQIQSVYREDHPVLLRLRREEAMLLKDSSSHDVYNDTLKQLQQQQDNLSALQSKYTEDHPQIIKAERMVEQLVAAMNGMKKRDEAPRADNPAYLFLKTQLDSTNEDIRANTQKIESLNKKIERYEGYLSRGPQIEQVYQTLIRDYQNLYAKYQEIRSKMMSAELAKNLESERKGERFTLIQPPELPIYPISPNRTALVLIGVIMGVGAGVGIVILLEALSNGVYSRIDLVSLTGNAPLAVISYLETQEEQSKHNMKRLYIVLGLILVGIIFLLLFHFFIKPLDVTWYVLLRKLGI
ncbi:MAG: hypothetical protein P8M71_10815 [Pseudomonadales bacterium]|nr:hypothetical protein [Pseudomonadales bacterium]